MDLFGAPTGPLEGSDDGSDLKNGYDNIADRSVDEMTKTDRVQPRQVASGATRGTRRIESQDGSYVALGEIPDGSGDFGIAFFDANGNLISKSTGSTDYKYDLSTGKNYYQNGLLPDNSYGAIYAKSGFNVADVIS